MSAWPPEDQDALDRVLCELWAGALDAKAMVDGEGFTEEDYIRVQSARVAQAKAQVVRLLDRGPA